MARRSVLSFRSTSRKSNIDGELAYFKGLEGPGADFEKPYGYAWLLKLYGELKTWTDPEGQRVAVVLEPLATWMAAQYVTYLHRLDYPVRVGLHSNTGLTMGFVLDYTALVHDTATQMAIHDTALRLFGADKHCATNSEPVFGDFTSPCLAEAALMGRVMTPAEYSKWLDTFLPPVYANEFQLYAKDIDAVHGNNRDTTGTDEEGLPNAHLIGLNYQRAADLVTIAQSLPQGEPRVEAYRRMARINAKQGYDKIGQQAIWARTGWRPMLCSTRTSSILLHRCPRPLPKSAQRRSRKEQSIEPAPGRRACRRDSRIAPMRRSQTLVSMPAN